MYPENSQSFCVCDLLVIEFATLYTSHAHLELQEAAFCVWAGKGKLRFTLSAEACILP